MTKRHTLSRYGIDMTQQPTPKPGELWINNKTGNVFKVIEFAPVYYQRLNCPPDELEQNTFMTDQVFFLRDHRPATETEINELTIKEIIE